MAKLIAKPRGELNEIQCEQLSAQCDLVTSENVELYRFLDIQESFTVLAYGETNSGKTYTINSIIEHIVSALRFPLHVSAIEVYNNDYYTLHPVRRKISTPYKTINVSIANYNEFKDVFSGIKTQRIQRTTNQNKRSSRSHLIVSIIHRGTSYTCVDLAGSEKHADADSSFIKISLLCLRECVLALQEKRQMIPYRRSKLTMILKEHLQKQLYCVCTFIPSFPMTRNTKNTIEYGLSMKGLSMLHNKLDTEIEKYVKHTIRLSKLEEVMLSDYRRRRHPNLLSIVKQALWQRLEVTKHMLTIL